MSDRHGARQTSEVRSHQLRSEPIQSSSGSGIQVGTAARRTTRFRLERVSLLPFIPAPLLAYVERTQRRRRLRRAIGVLAPLLVLGGSAALMHFYRASTASSSPAAREIAEVLRAAPPAEPARSGAPALGASPDLTSRANGGASPAKNPSEISRAGDPVPQTSKKSNPDAPRSAPKRPPNTPPDWWW